MTIGTRIISAGESVVCAELDDEAVLLDVASGIYYGLDSTAAVIWRLLAERCSESELLSKLESEYEVDPEVLRRDVDAFLMALEAKGLVTIDLEVGD